MAGARRQSERFAGNAAAAVQKRELLQRKAALIDQRATPPLALQCQLKNTPLAQTLQNKFDVVLVDPPMSCHTYDHL